MIQPLKPQRGCGVSLPQARVWCSFRSHSSVSGRTAGPQMHEARPLVPGRASPVPSFTHALQMESGQVRQRGSSSPHRASSSGEAHTEPARPAPSPLLLLSVAVASMGALAFGYHLGVVNGPLEAIAADLGFGGNASLQGAVVSSLLAGAFAGSLAGSGLADSLGRRKAFLISTLPLFLGALLSATASGLSSMLAGRVLAGMGIGLCSALVPIYISEVSPTQLRGTLGSINQLLICIGILAALLVNVALPATSWRSMFWLAALPAVALGLGMLFAPESPRWLASRSRRSEAEGEGKRLWGAQAAEELGEGAEQAASAGSCEMEPLTGPALPEAAGTAAGADGNSDAQAAAAAELEQQSSSEKVVPSGAKAAEASWGEALASKSVRIGCILFLLQQFSGINAIVYFSSSVFQAAGIKSGALASAAVGACNVLGTVVAAGLMDKAGRKQLISVSFTGMGVSMLAMALGMWLPGLSALTGAIALLGTLSYILCFAVGAGPVPALLIPEINGARLRGRAMSLAMASHWINNFVVGQLFLGAVSTFGVPAVYTFFAGVCFAAVAFVGRSVVETKNRSLEEIEREMMAL